VGPEKGRVSKAGRPMNAGETPAAAGRLIGLPCVGGRVTASRPVVSVSAAWQLRAGWSPLIRRRGNCQPVWAAGRLRASRSSLSRLTVLLLGESLLLSVLQISCLDVHVSVAATTAATD
jgi:hypothetical protein